MILLSSHVDHAGCGKWFVDVHQATTYLSEIDDKYWKENPTKPDKPETWKNFNINVFLKEGDVIDCGDKKLYVYDTPGHTPGCLSYIFPVSENNQVHMAALFGGATPPWNDEAGKVTFQKSVQHFKEVTKKMNVDVMLSNHTLFDEGLERIAYSKKRCAYMPNIYVLGQDGVQQFMKMYEKLG